MSRAWLEVKEAGSSFGLRFVLWLCNSFGRPRARAFLRLLVLYYALVHRGARRASREYRERLELPVGFASTYRHLLCFAESVLDRVLFFRNDWGALTVKEHGLEELTRLRSERKGAILLGAHFGSFEALRAHGAFTGLKLSIVGNFDNARRINRLLEELGSGSNVCFINASQDPASLALKLRDAVERGELVAMLADRVDRGAGVQVDFLGARAWFPSGPYALAAVLRCPVLLTFSVYSAPSRYDLYCEPFADVVTLPRERRAEALAEQAQRFAHRLEEFCRLAPDNWFNFYDFWGEASSDGAKGSASPGVRS